MMLRHHPIVAMLVIFLLLMLVSPALAQDEIAITTPERAAELLTNALVAIAGGLLNAPAVILLTSLAKRYLPDSIGAATIQLAIAILLTALLWVGMRFGVDKQMTSVLDLIEAALPILMTLFTGSAAASTGYSWAKRQNVPIAGYQRPARN